MDVMSIASMSMAMSMAEVQNAASVAVMKNAMDSQAELVADVMQVPLTTGVEGINFDIIA